MIAVLTEKRVVTDRDVLYTFECLEMAQKAKAGQFVEVRVSEGMEPFLRRPISIFDVDGTKLRLLVRTVGTGTRMMKEWEPGQEADILGPLGNGFRVAGEEKHVLLVGGGIGAAPLYELAEVLKAQDTKIEYLFSPKRDAAVMGAYDALTDELVMHYSENRRELPVVLEEILKAGDSPVDMVYTCGPTAMMHTVRDVCVKCGVPVQVSLEEKMGCGMGLCTGCVVKIRNGEDFDYKKVCHDGPVFRGEEVIFE